MRISGKDCIPEDVQVNRYMDWLNKNPDKTIYVYDKGKPKILDMILKVYPFNRIKLVDKAGRIVSS